MEPTEYDNRCMKLAMDARKQSECKRRNVGVVIYNGGAFASVGYNDTLLPSQKHCIRSGYKEGERLDLCPAIHAEVMAIANASRCGFSTEGSTLYTTSCVPCRNCMQVIALAGVNRIIVRENKDYGSDISSRKLADIYDIRIDHLPFEEDSDG